MKYIPALFCGLLLCLTPGLGAADEPALPIGLGGNDEPALPSGLGGSDEPALPSGLGGASTENTDAEGFEEKEPWLNFSGFWEVRTGVRTQNDPHEKDASIGETRFQASLDKAFSRVQLGATGDLLFDPVIEDYKTNLETGDGVFDLRELYALGQATSFLDLKVGRQILTWGVGDLLFINDLFPKDWNSFFIGRDTEYLKAPSDAIKAAFFSDYANLDVIYTPRFDADRYIDGRRISYYNPQLGQTAGRDAVIETEKPDEWFKDDEWSLRLYRNIKAVEVALYSYFGFWKSPQGFNPASGLATFPKLNVYGGSARSPLWGGIGSFELGYYDSRDDSNGDNPFVENSQLRFLLGFERELGADVTAGVQYYLEHMLDHSAYRSSLPAGAPEKDENRHVLTLRFTKFLLQQNLRLSLFAYYSPSDVDGYLRPIVHYKLNDYWSVEGGGNVFFGRRDYTFFGQFDRNTNVYGAVRYAF